MSGDSWARLFAELLHPTRQRQFAGAAIAGTIATVLLVRSLGARLSSILAAVESPAWATFALLGIAGYGAGILFVTLLLWTSRTFGSSLSAWRAARAERGAADRRAHEWHLKLPEILPFLSEEQKDVLIALRLGPRVYSLYDNTLSSLRHVPVVEMVNPVDDGHGLYRLKPATASIVAAFCIAEERTRAKAGLLKAGKAGEELLRLFSLEDPADEDHFEHPEIGSEVHSAHYDLCKAGVLEREYANGAEVLRLSERGVEMLQEVLGQPVRRSAVRMNPSRILSRVDAGSGVTNRF